MQDLGTSEEIFNLRNWPLANLAGMTDPLETVGRQYIGTRTSSARHYAVLNTDMKLAGTCHDTNSPKNAKTCQPKLAGRLAAT